MALQVVLQKPIIHENLLHARDVAGVPQGLLLNRTVHYNITSPNTLRKEVFHTVGKLSWSWLKYRQLGVSPLVDFVSHLFGLTVLVASVIYLALRLAQFIRRDPDFQRREMFKSKVKKVVFILTPSILLPGYIGAWYIERKFYEQSWSPGSSGDASYQGMGYPGRYTNKTLGPQAVTELTTLAKGSYANLTYESRDLRKMAYVSEVTMPAIKAASLDIVALCIPFLVLMFLIAAIVGVFRYLTGRHEIGAEDGDEKTMA